MGPGSQLDTNRSPRQSAVIPRTSGPRKNSSFSLQKYLSIPTVSAKVAEVGATTHADVLAIIDVTRTSPVDKRAGTATKPRAGLQQCDGYVLIG